MNPLRYIKRQQGSPMQCFKDLVSTTSLPAEREINSALLRPWEHAAKGWLQGAMDLQRRVGGSLEQIAITPPEERANCLYRYQHGTE